MVHTRRHRNSCKMSTEDVKKSQHYLNATFKLFSGLPRGNIVPPRPATHWKSSKNNWFTMNYPGIQCAKSSMLLFLLTHFTVYFCFSTAAPSPLFCFECRSLDLLGCMRDALGPTPSSADTPNLLEELRPERIWVLVCWHVSCSSWISSRSEAILELHVSRRVTGKAVKPAIFISKASCDPHNDSSDVHVAASRSPRPTIWISHTGSGTEESEPHVTPSDPYSEEEVPHQTPGRRPACSDKEPELDLCDSGCERPWVLVRPTPITDRLLVALIRGVFTLLAAKMMSNGTIRAATIRNAE